MALQGHWIIAAKTWERFMVPKWNFTLRLLGHLLSPFTRPSEDQTASSKWFTTHRESRSLPTCSSLKSGLGPAKKHITTSNLLAQTPATAKLFKYDILMVIRDVSCEFPLPSHWFSLSLENHGSRWSQKTTTIWKTPLVGHSETLWGSDAINVTSALLGVTE